MLFLSLLWYSVSVILHLIFLPKYPSTFIKEKKEEDQNHGVLFSSILFRSSQLAAGNVFFNFHPHSFLKTPHSHPKRKKNHIKKKIVHIPLWSFIEYTRFNFFPFNNISNPWIFQSCSSNQVNNVLEQAMKAPSFHLFLHQLMLVVVAPLAQSDLVRWLIELGWPRYLSLR